MSSVQIEQRPVKLTYDDLAAFPDDGRRHELLDGEHLVTPSPRTRHQRVLVHLVTALERHCGEHGLGRVYPGPVDLVFSPNDVLVPDLVFVSSARLATVTETRITAAPEIVVEILSPSTARRDRGAKRRLYEKFGVREYWLIDIDARILERVVFGDTAGGHAIRLEPGDRLETDLLPGVVLPVGLLFRE